MTPAAGRRRRSPRSLLLLWDRVWLRRWHRYRGPLWLDRLLLALVRLGDGWGWGLVVLVLATTLPLPRFAWMTGQGLFAAALTIPLYAMMKARFRRVRPHQRFKRVSARVSPRDEYSFPSGHTMNNLAIAVSIAFHLPWLWPFALALPVGIGLLRVMFGVHFVSDIVAGTVFGLLVGGIAFLVFPLLVPPPF